MAFNKLVAVFLVCIVFGAALNAEMAAAHTTEKFKSCYDACIEQCLADNRGYTFCEMRCDGDCTEKELLDNLKTRFG